MDDEVDDDRIEYEFVVCIFMTAECDRYIRVMKPCGEDTPKYTSMYFVSAAWMNIIDRRERERLIFVLFLFVTTTLLAQRFDYMI